MPFGDEISKNNAEIEQIISLVVTKLQLEFNAAWICISVTCVHDEKRWYLMKILKKKLQFSFFTYYSISLLFFRLPCVFLFSTSLSLLIFLIREVINVKVTWLLFGNKFGKVHYCYSIFWSLLQIIDKS